MVCAYLLSVFFALLPLLKSKKRPKQEPHELARDRKNVALWARVQSQKSGKEYCFGTYHMPCVFWAPQVMMIHAELTMSWLQKKSGNVPLIFGGDFNCKKNEAVYSYITSASFEKDSPAFPKAPYKASFDLKNGAKPMRSAYKELLGEEPDFTNFAHVKPFAPSMEDKPFIDCIDYIFITEELEVLDVLKTSHRDQFAGPIPTADEPSDHIMLGATLTLKSEESSRRNKIEQPDRSRGRTRSPEARTKED